METNPLLPIRLTRDDNEETEENRGKQNNPLINKVKSNLKQGLESVEIIENREDNIYVSIYKVPNFIREANPTAFEPKVVSFGPYHHGKEHLLPMEVEKLKVFENFIINYRLDVHSIVEKVWTILEHLFRSYDKVDEEWRQNPDRFLQLMIVDGCFMVQFFMECPKSLINMSVDIVRDMLMLENQLPLKLLHDLYSLANQNQQLNMDLSQLVCNSLDIFGDYSRMEQCHHILDIYKSSLLFDMMGKRDVRSGKPHCDLTIYGRIISPITRLLEARIKLKRSETNSLRDVWFDRKEGVLTLPQLILDKDTELKLLNVMAFEKLHIRAGKKVTSFIILMSNLINEDRDVALLGYKNILLNFIGNDQDATDVIIRLRRGAVADLDFRMKVVHAMINEHCNQPWNKLFFDKLNHYYFRNPWALISFYATVLGFLLLIAQFTYQLLDYYAKP